PFLQRQRWFGSKSREVLDARFSDWTMIRDGANPAFLATATVEYSGARSETYLVPLAFASGDEAARILSEAPGLVLARVTGARKGVLMDGLLDDDACNHLIDMIGRQTEVATRHGSVRGELIGGNVDFGVERKWTRFPGDQSNTLALLNDRHVLKLFRRVEPGPNPEFEITRFLSQ